VNSDNSNYDGYANLRQTLAIGASTDQGLQAGYSEPGANLLVNAPSNGGQSQITTTDRTGQPGYSTSNYTATFGGTSAAAPLVAGVIALMLEANPDLGWRDVRWILAHTAQLNDPGHPDWVTNGAGLAVNHNYGFGRVDGLAAVTMSGGWSGLGPDRSVQALVEPSIPIPDNDPSGISSSVTINDDFTVEFVDITFSAPDHPFWGDLEVVLTSPAGTRSVLAESHSSGRTSSFDNWRFGSTRHLGESSRGTWTLTVRDLLAGDSGTFTGWRVEIHGHDRGEPNSGQILPGAMLMPVLMLLLEE
jgi:kexin